MIPRSDRDSRESQSQFSNHPNGATRMNSAQAEHLGTHFAKLNFYRIEFLANYADAFLLFCSYAEPSLCMCESLDSDRCLVLILHEWLLNQLLTRLAA